MLYDKPYFRGYILGALQETPSLLRYVLAGMTDEQADARVDPDRFTLREAIAHLADWETVFRWRLKKMVDEEEPILANIDEGKRAIENRYSDLDWREQLLIFGHRRSETIEYVHALPVEAWSRKGNRPEIGILSVAEMVQLIPFHDLYHLKQAREYLTP